MESSFPSQKHHRTRTAIPHESIHALLAVPDQSRAQRLSSGMVEMGWKCDLSTNIWDALARIEMPRYTHLVADLRQMSSEDHGGMLLAWTWLRSGRKPPMVLGHTESLHREPAVRDGRILLLEPDCDLCDIWARMQRFERPASFSFHPEPLPLQGA
ncbi:MAG: hypothetical protein H6686_02000 [Fibrobacteria bacterium]|nr:hypothetical protein [Fibrobacteria bacterium]